MLTLEIFITAWRVRRYFQFLFLVFIFVSSLTFCSKGVSEIEPLNNVRKDAQKIESGQEFIGTFYSRAGNDIDYVYLTVDAPKLITGELSALKGVDSEILFFNKGDALPFKRINDNKSSLGEHFGPFLIKKPGVVIALRSRNPVNDESYKDLKYKFSCSLLNPPSSVEVESNDTLKDATEIKESPIYGYYNNALNGEDIEKDYFYLELPEKIKYRVTARLSGVEGIDAFLKMYSDQEKLLVDEDNQPAGEGENIYSYGVEGPAKIYFMVGAKDFKTSIFPYELSVDALEYDEKYELEPNNDITHATPIKVDEMIGDFSNRDDVDFFKIFNASLDSFELSARLTADPQSDTVIEVYRTLNSKPEIFNDGPEGTDEGIANFPVRPLETIYLKISRKNASGPATYTFKTYMKTHEEGFESENNNTPKKSNTIEMGTAVMGYINPGSDIDYYRVKIPNQEKVKINLKKIPSCRASISVLDAREIKTDSVNSGEKEEEISLETIIEPNGYIVLKCEDMEQPSFTEPYELTVSGEK